MDLTLASIPFKLPAARTGDGLVEPAQCGSSIGAMGETRKGSSGPASHRNPGAYPSAGPARDLRPSIRHVIDRVHRSSTKIGRRDGRGPNRGLCVQKKGAFNRGGQQAPIEFRGKTTKDVAVSIETLRAPRRLATTCDRTSIERCKMVPRKSIIVAFMSRPDRAVCFCCSLSGVVKVSHILASLIYLDAKR